MSLRYQRRIGDPKGFGINVSNSGITPSYRTEYGTIGARGFSIRTGIPGLSFRSSYGTGKRKGNIALILFAVVAVGFVLYYSAVIAYNLVRFVIWAFGSLFTGMIDLLAKWKQEKQQKNHI
jgi:hypothetical protein